MKGCHVRRKGVMTGATVLRPREFEPEEVDPAEPVAGDDRPAVGGSRRRRRPRRRR